MSGKDPVRNLGSAARAGLAALVLLLGAPASARAGDGLWDSMMEKLNLKASPAEAPPDFVQKTRPDAGGLTYLPPAVPHKVSPLAVKTPAEIQAAKDALDAAQVHQTHPNAPIPLQAGKGARHVAPPRHAKPRPAAGVSD